MVSETVDTNQFHVMPQGALAKVGVPETAQITKIGSHEISNWESLIQAVEAETKDKTAPTLDVTISERVETSKSLLLLKKSRSLPSRCSTGD